MVAALAPLSTMVALPLLPASPATTYSMVVEIAFVTNPYGALSWTDVSALVTDVQTKRGKNVANGAPEAGTASVTLWNIDGRFDPGNTSGPYWPNVTPRRPIRITVLSGATFGVWRGFVNSWPQTYPGLGGAYTQCVLSCNDGFTNVLDAKLGPRYADVITADIGTTTFYYPNATNAAPTSATPSTWTPASPGFPTSTPMTGSLGNPSIGDGWQRLVSGTSGLEWRLDSTTGSPLTFVRSAEVRFRVHVGDSAGTHPTLSVLAPSSTRSVYLVHSGTAGSGWALAFGTAPGTLLSTWGDLAIDQIIALAIVREVGNGYKLYVNGALWYDSTADTADATMFVALFKLVATVVTAGTTIDREQFVGYTATPTSPPGPGQLTDTMAMSHYTISGLAGNAIPDFASQTTGARVGAALDVVGWPAGDRSLEAGLSTLTASGSVNGKTALDIILDASRAELGDVFIDGTGKVVFQQRSHRNGAATTLTLGDGTGEMPYAGDVVVEYDAVRILNEVTVAQSIGTSPQTSIRTDATSVTAYGLQSLSVSVPLLNAADCDSMADTLIARYKDPHQRVETVTIDLAANVSRVPVVLAREIGDLIRFRRRPPGGSPIDISNVLQGVELHYTLGPQRTLTLTMHLDPALSNATY